MSLEIFGMIAGPGLSPGKAELCADQHVHVLRAHPTLVSKMDLLSYLLRWRVSYSPPWKMAALESMVSSSTSPFFFFLNYLTLLILEYS